VNRRWFGSAFSAIALAGLWIVACSTAAKDSAIAAVNAMGGGAAGSLMAPPVGGGGAASEAGHPSTGGGSGTSTGSSGTASELDAAAELDSGVSISDAGDAAASPITGPEYYFGVTVDPGACLDVTGAGTSDGTLLEEWSCNASAAQSFIVPDAGSGNVHLVAATAQKCIEPVGGGTGNGTKIQLAKCDGSAAQTYTLKDQGNGLISILNVGTGKCLDVPGARVAAGTQLQLYDCNQSPAQLWTRAAIGAGYTGSCAVGQLQAGSVLADNCKNDARTLSSPALDLNACLTNANGSLAWQNNGGFAGSCTGCALKNGSSLTCQCKNVSAQSTATTIDLSANINNCNGILTCGACGGGGPTSDGPRAFTALYGGDGNDFYQFTGASSVANLKTSGWNALFMFGISLQSNGDITHSGTTLVHDGVYVGDANWGPSVSALKSQPTSVTRYEVTLGGWGDTSYEVVKSLVGSQGTGSASTLYENFDALKKAVPGIDAINDDDELTYDIDSSTAFGKMLNGLGLKLTQAPYMNQGFWVQLKNNLGSGCDIVYLQCYQGGAGNDPGNWDAAYGNGFHVVPGQESNNHAASWWANWRSADQVTGGFYWPDVTWDPGANWGVGEIAGGLGLPPL
jgi:hypothetical protein